MFKKTCDFLADVIKTLDISLEGEFIATGSQDRVIKVWKPKTNDL